jgi:hypothetical protein
VDLIDTSCRSRCNEYSDLTLFLLHVFDGLFSPLLNCLAIQHLDIMASKHYSINMRTTVTLDDDVYHAALTLSEASGKALGKVLSDLARNGLEPRRPRTRRGKALPAFEVPAGTPLISLESVRRAWEEE